MPIVSAYHIELPSHVLGLVWWNRHLISVQLPHLKAASRFSPSAPGANPTHAGSLHFARDDQPDDGIKLGDLVLNGESTAGVMWYPGDGGCVLSTGERKELLFDIARVVDGQIAAISQMIEPGDPLPSWRVTAITPAGEEMENITLSHVEMAKHPGWVASKERWPDLPPTITV
jgi:hypothetical protein